MNYKFYEHINISNVINKLHLEKTAQIGNNIYVKCPFCLDVECIMKANMINNLFICNRCGKSGTSISLYADNKYLTNKEAYKILLREMPVLNKSHQNKLLEMGFSEEYIVDNRFKSIENNASRKKEICKRLQEDGLKLEGISRLLSRYRF